MAQPIWRTAIFSFFFYGMVQCPLLSNVVVNFLTDDWSKITFWRHPPEFPKNPKPWPQVYIFMENSPPPDTEVFQETDLPHNHPKIPNEIFSFNPKTLVPDTPKSLTHYLTKLYVTMLFFASRLDTIKRILYKNIIIFCIVILFLSLFISLPSVIIHI